MIVVISGTNRQGSKTFQIASAAAVKLREIGRRVELLDLRQLPREIIHPTAYAEKPASFEPLQNLVLDAAGILFVIPEYNGSFPGILKLFIDMLRFPESFNGTPVGFIGLGGRLGGMRPVDQMSLILQYRGAHIFGKKVIIPEATKLVVHDTHIDEGELQERFEGFLFDFSYFVGMLRGDSAMH